MRAGRARVPFTHVGASIVALPLAAPPIAAPRTVAPRTVAEPMCAVAWAPLPLAPPPTVQPQPPTTMGHADITQIRPATELALRDQPKQRASPVYRIVMVVVTAGAFVFVAATVGGVFRPAVYSLASAP